MLCDTREEIVATSDAYACEHLEVHCADLDWWHARLTNYGSLFLGEETNVAFGDKVSGTEPYSSDQARRALFGGPLRAQIPQTADLAAHEPRRLQAIAPVAARISRLEGMEAHARTSDVRMAKYAPGSNVDLGHAGRNLTAFRLAPL